MNRAFRFTLAALSCLALTAQAADLAAGKAKSEQVCASCHLADGNSTNPQYPILAGQHPDYLRKALRDYQSGARSNAIMADQAKALSKAEIDNLSAWFASQPSKLNMAR
ncbi:cytochrome c [Chitinimonas arctica]|uniref:Cytochrome c n=1 Tax=Chitinimonas arctica TaxID=2594795 RepID=A0A516SHB8_9NEIS|nr:cytochrome c [Chitinimonas arctica]QDQ27535.1 cytochrome c [Chitinimonas arctica]